MLRRNGTDPDIRDRIALRFGEQTWTHGEFLAEASRVAVWLRRALPPGRPPHVAVLLDNTPDYLFAFGGAALVGAAVVGLNHTRHGEHLLADVEHTHAALVVTEPRHVHRLDPVAGSLPPVFTSTRFVDADDPADAHLGASLDDVLPPLEVPALPVEPAGPDPDVDTPWALVFTSGTSDRPKAVICSQRRLLVTGTRMSILMDVGPDDCGYVCMPLFHSNAIQVGWAPALVTGAAVGLGRRFSVSRWLPDVRRYGATYFNYTGKPLAYLLTAPEHPDDHDNPVRVAFGNEGSPEVVARFSARFGVEVIDAYGATEGGVAVTHEPGQPPGALGRAPDSVQVVDEAGVPRPVATFDERGRLTNAEDCVGEIVNTAGVGPFEGYYNDPEANARTTRFGWYWSGDLGYFDDQRYLYFAGRNADWIRVDGENFPAAPIEAAVARHPDVVLAAVYGVPDAQAGDQVMAAVVLRDGASFDPEAFAVWIDAEDAIEPKWRPRYVRVLRDPPTTGTNKIVKRTLVHEKWRSDRVGGDDVYARDRGEPAYRRIEPADEASLRREFTRAGRDRFWEL